MTDEKRPGLPPSSGRGAAGDAPRQLGEEAVSLEEEAAATALRQALEEGGAAGSVQAEAEAAAFLGFSRDAGALAPARGQAVLERVLAARPRPRRRWWLWAVPATACAAAAAALLLVTLRGPGPGLPPPPRALLEAQLAAARGGVGAGAALDREMGAYREGIYATLGKRYLGGR